MLVDVTLLRRKGLRLRAAELDPPVRGMLETQWMTETSFGRPMKVAQVFSEYGTVRQRSLLTIGDVTLEAIKDGSFSLAGVELESYRPAEEKRRRIIEHRQVWRCVPVAMP